MTEHGWKEEVGKEERAKEEKGKGKKVEIGYNKVCIDRKAWDMKI